jgi:hypothetical protein
MQTQEQNPMNYEAELRESIRISELEEKIRDDFWDKMSGNPDDDPSNAFNCLSPSDALGVMHELADGIAARRICYDSLRKRVLNSGDLTLEQISVNDRMIGYND